jgi:hypothetical protein
MIRFNEALDNVIRDREEWDTEIYIEKNITLL